LLLSAGASCQQGAEQQTRRTPLTGQTDRLTDRQTTDRYIDLAPRTASSVSNTQLYFTTKCDSRKKE